MHPQPGGNKNNEPTSKSTTSSASRTGFPRAMVLRFPSCSPRWAAFLSPLPHQHRPAWIDATVAAPGPHDFAVRCSDLVRQQKPPDAAASIAFRSDATW